MNNEKFEDKLGYKLETIMKKFDYYSSERLPYEKLWKLLDSYDSGEFWKYVAKIMPSYSIKPDTNWISYIKENKLNSLYTGTYRGDVFCRKYDNEQTTLAINEFLEYMFNKLKINEKQFAAGERAALLNFGATEFGWNADIIDGVSDENGLFHGDVEAKHIDNMSLFLDPAAVDYQKGQAIFIAEECSIAELINEPRFKERMRAYLKELKDNPPANKMSQRDYGKGYYGERHHNSDDNTVRLLTCYYKHYTSESDGYRLDKIWILEDDTILDVQLDVRPKIFPIMILYATKPIKDPYGIPIAKKILNNSITLNLLDSIDATLIYNNLRRPKVLSRRAGINEVLFAKEGNNPDKLWVVDGDPNAVLRYIDYPDIDPNRLNLLRQRLEANIMRIANIDDTYTGADTNSIQTTGGMDLLNQRLTMRDNNSAFWLQKYILDITEYIMLLYIENGNKRKFPVRDKYNEVSAIKELDFEKMKAEHLKFDFTCDITPNLPNNVQRRGEIANQLMEKQMQYNFNPQLISPEEWVAQQDFPQKYKILQRIRAERMRDDKQDLESDIINYAGLVNQGMRPESAIDQLTQEKQFKRDNPESAIGNVQRRQQG